MKYSISFYKFIFILIERHSYRHMMNGWTQNSYLIHSLHFYQIVYWNQIINENTVIWKSAKILLNKTFLWYMSMLYVHAICPCFSMKNTGSAYTYWTMGLIYKVRQKVITYPTGHGKVVSMLKFNFMYSGSDIEIWLRMILYVNLTIQSWSIKIELKLNYMVAWTLHNGG